MYVFGVYNIDKGRYASDFAMERFADGIGMDVVPCVGFYDTLPSREEIIALADGKSYVEDIPREGCVWRHYSKNDQNQLEKWLAYSFKAISNNFLVKEKD